MLCIFQLLWNALLSKVLKWISFITLSFRDNWQDMMTEEIKSLFRKANRPVDKHKIWKTKKHKEWSWNWQIRKDTRQAAWERHKGQHKHVCFTAAYKDYFNRIDSRLSNPTLPSTAETTALMKWQVVSESVFLSQCLMLSYFLSFGHKVAVCASHTKGELMFGIFPSLPHICYSRWSVHWFSLIFSNQKTM